jgi:hypothetical protein
MRVGIEIAAKTVGRRQGLVSVHRLAAFQINLASLQIAGLVYVQRALSCG